MNNFSKQNIGKYNGEKINDYYKLVKDGTEKEDGGVDANVFKYLKEIFPKNLEGQNIIDLGSGDARWSKYLQSLNAKKVYGLDISEDMLKKAKEKYSNVEGLNLIQGDMQKLPFKDNSIDKALSTFSIMYFKNLDDVIKEIQRVLKKDGELYIATNIINIENEELLAKLKGKNIPVDLGFENKIKLENLVQPIEQYRDAFEGAGLKIINEEHFEPTGVEISADYEYKDKMELEKVVFVVKKI